MGFIEIKEASVGLFLAPNGLISVEKQADVGLECEGVVLAPI